MFPLSRMLSPDAYITLMMLPLFGMLFPDACNTLSLLLKSNHPRKNLPDDLIQNVSRLSFVPFSLSSWHLIFHYIFLIYCFPIWKWGWTFIYCCAWPQLQWLPGTLQVWTHLSTSFPGKIRVFFYVTVFLCHMARSCAMHESKATSLLKELITFGEKTFWLLHKIHKSQMKFLLY